MRYLLAAEADKIQDFIFRSSRLREVVGASQLLTRFCRSVQDTLASEYKGQIVVNDGGSFRVIFDAKPKAVAFGADLAELYRLALGGSLTVAEPVELNGDFRKANDEAGKKLRWAKSRRQGVVADPHMAYAAFCASCGIALASERTKLAREREESRNRYLCDDCLNKASESATNRSDMLDEFLSDVIEDRSQLSSYEFLFEPEKIGNYDIRNYVAYLVADGNGMGMLFGSLQNEQALRDFSDGMSSAVRRSLATATQRLRDQTGKLSSQNAWSVPVLPLILGGDDVFALIPAPYSLDFAREFCLTWEQQMRALMEQDSVALKIGEGGIPRPTVAAAVVICKSKYPYALAHRRAEALLKEAKRQSKLLAAETGEHLSSVNFGVILGNRLAGLEDEDEQSASAVRSTLRPYWVVRDGLSTTAQGRGIDLAQLLAQRVKLKNIPNKRLAELRRCFEDLPTNNLDVHNRTQAMENWTNRKLSRFLSRLGKAARNDVETALQALGKPNNDGNGNHHWREVQRGNVTLLAHGMLDLLEVWDCAQDLDLGPDEYEAEEVYE